MLLALEAGSPLRGLVLLLCSPIIWCIWHLFLNEALAIQILIFVSLAGVKFSDVVGVSKAVLPKFLLEDLHSESYKVLVSCSKRYVLTFNPRVMVEYFLKTHVGVEEVFGTELQVTRGGYCTGLVSQSGVLLDKNKADTVKKVFLGETPDVGLGNNKADNSFLSFCKEAYVVVDAMGSAAVNAEVPREQYMAPLVFHDGRLVKRPTFVSALVIFLWTPIGLTLALMRITTALCLPMEIGFPCAALLGVCVRVKGAPPLPLPKGHKQGLLFVCSHRSLLDPTFLCLGLRRKVRALVYSVSRVSELISPIKTAHLTRDRKQDAKLIGELLEKEEDLFICPEGTTGREPYLLRFSPLFAELTDHIVPVALRVRMSMFHGTTARGNKALDAFFLMMNPRPVYEIIFLDRLEKEETVAGGKTSVEVAKFVQGQLAEALGYVCTDFTRKDKYRILAGNDGTVKDKRFTNKSLSNDSVNENCKDNDNSNGNDDNYYNNNNNSYSKSCQDHDGNDEALNKKKQEEQ